MGRSFDLQCVLVADDLTGACDAGVQFVNRGLRCDLLLEPEYSLASQLPDVVACTTDSRGDSEEEAANRVAIVASKFGALSPQYVFKKIDSTFRGNVASEIQACMDSFECSCVLIAPAFPAMQRTVERGVLRWNDCSGASKLDIHSALCKSFGNVANIQTGVAGEAELADEMRQAVAAGTLVLLADGASQEDLRKVVVAGARLPGRMLWVGSGGLAMELAKHLRPGQVALHGKLAHGNGPVIFCIGSDHPVTAAQEEFLLRQADAETVNVSRASVDSARRALRQRRDIVLRIRRGVTTELEFRDFFLALEGLPMAGMLMSGGDTGAMVCRALRVNAIHLESEIVIGLPWGVAVGGVAHGMRVATKSGGFGAEDALIRVAEFFAPARKAVK